MVCPVLHVARVDATMWAGSPDHAAEFGSSSRGSPSSQDEKEHEEDDKSRLWGDC